MIALTVLYPKAADSHFDLPYYLNTHIPLVKERLTSMGLTNVIMQEAVEPNAPFAMITSLVFSTGDELGAGMGAHGPELMGDIPNFTNVTPQTQVCQLH